MTDLRTRLHDAAATAEGLDLEAVRARASVLRRRRTTLRFGAPALAVVALVAGLLTAGGSDDEAPILTDRPVTSTTAETPLDGAEDVVGDPGPTTPDTATERVTPARDTPGRDHSDRGAAPAPGGDTEPPPGDPLIRDEADDTEAIDPWAVPGTTRDPEPMLDLREGDIAPVGASLAFAITVTDLADGPPPGADGVSYRFGFDYFSDRAQTSLLGVLMERVEDVEKILLVTDNGAWECAGCTVSFDADREVITGVVPVATLRDFAKQFDAHEGDVELRELRLQSSWVHTGAFGGNAVADDATGDGSFAVRQ